jgi:hypothetical protein
LQAWRQAGLIRIDKGACILLEPQRLRQIATEHQADDALYDSVKVRA